MQPPFQARPILLLAALALWLGLPLQGAASDQQESSGGLSRSEAEERLADLKEEIAGLQKTLEEARSEHRQEQEELRALDIQIDATSKESRSLEQQQAEQRAELADLEAEREAQLDRMSENQDQLGEILRSAYRLDRNSRLKLVLNQDDPTRLNRMLAYHEYFNRQQMANISILRESLEALEQMQRKISRELERLEATRRRLDETLQRLSGQRQTRLDLINTLHARIGSEESRLQELERNRQDLVQLLERLEDALADIPADLGARLGVAQQKGRLPMPLIGRVQHAFGQRRAGSLNWQGWLIGADPGSEVRSVAYGRVAFADWLRGYGLMLIIDHGNGFLSLYGNNESLLAEVGDWVEPGEAISVVGTNPGMSQGLYFELRKDGKAVDPAAWIER